MDERQLRILRELGELGSVTAVAEALLVTPSAISQQLRLLQRAIPVPLTEREGRRLVLTDAGQALAEAAIGVESALARARHTVDDFLDRPDGEVSVAAFHSAASAFFPLLLRGLAAPGGRAPALALADEDVPQEDFPRLTRTYDLVLAHRLDHAPPWPRTVTATTLLREPLDVALPTGHPLAARDVLYPDDVADEPWITVHDGFPVLATVEAVAAAAGRRLRPAHRINDFAVAAELVAAGGRHRADAPLDRAVAPGGGPTHPRRRTGPPPRRRTAPPGTGGAGGGTHGTDGAGTSGTGYSCG